MEASYLKLSESEKVKHLFSILPEETLNEEQGGFVCMLAHKFSEQSEKIIFPAFVQPKYDGTRAIGIRVNGVWGLWSRTRKPINSVPHIIAALNEYSKNGGEDHIFDGELYNHNYKD